MDHKRTKTKNRKNTSRRILLSRKRSPNPKRIRKNRKNRIQNRSNRKSTRNNDATRLYPNPTKPKRRNHRRRNKRNRTHHKRRKRKHSRNHNRRNRRHPNKTTSRNIHNRKYQNAIWIQTNQTKLRNTRQTRNPRTR